LKHFLFLLVITAAAFHLKAQNADCVFKKPVVTIHFGSGTVSEVNTAASYIYDRVSSSCPTDGHYTYTSYTSDCFSGDWLTLTEDHTPGDQDGNMMIVNASYRTGTFLTTSIIGLKSNTIYEFSAWMMNVCKPSDKCPFPLLPNITVRLETPAGKVVAQFNSGDLPRHEAPHWTPYRAQFTTPSTETPLRLVMSNNNPGGCGNDFALDDIVFRECEIVKPVITKASKPPAVKKPATKTPAVTKAPVVTKPPVKSPPVVKTTPKTEKPVIKKDTPVRRPLQTSTVKVKTDSSSTGNPVSKPKPIAFPSRPAVLMTRANPVIKQIAAEAGEIKLDLYDNGQIDGDTVSIYHNNRLLVSRGRLSAKAISFRITVDKNQPHHELVMVAENLGSIPPNTSLMIVTAGSNRYEVFISSTEQKNAKIVIDLKE
jgi:hypothetical protein